MYPGSTFPNFHRPHTPRDQYTRPRGHNYQENINRPQTPWQQQNTNNFQNEEFKFWCETCDKGFRYNNQLESHKLQHQKCNIDGCQYVAHPKVITRHIQMQHSSGLFKKISVLNNPEEIQKWREERKKKYPTKENIKKKKAEISERINRGEKMGMKYEKGKKRNDKIDSFNKRKQYTPGPKSHNLKRKLPSDVTKKQDQVRKICSTALPVQENRTLKPFAGIQHLINDDQEEVNEEINNIPIESDDDDDFIEKIEEIKEHTSEPTICGALTSLVCQYGSSDEEEVSDNSKLVSHHNNVESLNKKESDDKNNAKLNNSNVQNKLDKNNSHNKMLTNTEKPIESDNDSGPEETCIVKTEKNLELNNIKHTIQPKNKRNTLLKNIKSQHISSVKKRRKLPSTLLEKLLHKEILHERNIILQCIRHVVNSSFFDDQK